jgi:hypothetical protein
MTRRLTLSFLLVAVAFSAFAQVPPFGEAVPLANTRYGPAGGNLILRTDGRDTFVFWLPFTGRLLMTKFTPGERHVGRPVLDTYSGDGFDAVWAGDHFFVASAEGLKLTGSNIDRSGKPIGAPFTIMDGVAHPQLVYTGKSIILLYSPSTSSSALQSVALDRFGHPISAPQFLTLNGAAPAAAAAGTRVAVIMGSRLVILDENGQIVANREAAFSSWSIASDGTRFLAVSSSSNGITATLIGADGTSLRTITLANAGSSFFQVMWTGSVWKVAHSVNTKLNVVEIDRDATRVLSTNQNDWLGGNSLIAINERLVTALPSDGKILASEIPATQEGIEEVGFSANEQTLLATARSTGAVLVVWRERNAGAYTIRAGVRSSEGVWRERELASGTSAIAASNGSEFVVIVNGNKLFRLNESGVPLANSLLPFEVLTIGWNGQNYGAYGQSQFALLSSTGTVGTVKPAQIPSDYFPCAPMASDGQGFFTACNIPSTVIIPPASSSAGLFGVRFDATGLVLNTFSINGAATIAGVAFDGRRYLIGWNDGSTAKVTYSDPMGPDTRIVATDARRVSISNNAISSGAFVGWLDNAAQYRVAFVDNNGNVSASMIAERGIEPYQTALLQLDHFHLLRIYTSYSSNAAPYYGVPHVMSQTGLIAFPYLPDPPKLTVTRGAGTARLEWQTSGKRIDVFRIEYAVGDGVWLEMETSLDSSHHSFDFPLFWPDLTYSFRVRAINEAGSVYSTAVTSMNAKRRAVR